jgi:hypothetical protein
MPICEQEMAGDLPLGNGQCQGHCNHILLFWETREECYFFIAERVESYRPPTLPTARAFANDSDDSDSESDLVQDKVVGTGTILSDNEEDTGEEPEQACPVDDEPTNNDPQGDRWEQDCDYLPPEPLPMEQFDEYQTASACSGRTKTGLQCLEMEVNTPIRAWRQIFQNHLLDKIVRYTNNYGQLHAKRWQDMTRKDLESFSAVLFISGIQKRKDKPANWWSDNKLLELAKVMSGRKFFDILCYLHCCPVENQDSTANNYDPIYKVKEVKDYLESRYDQLFSPGQQLSLDETLIRALGRIKFKVRIVTESARYGIKIYVITDAVKAFVLRVLVYTGKTAYHDDSESAAEKLKTVQIVNRLVEPFAGSHRMVYVDRFYTSLDLLKSLAEKNLYLTGTMLANRIPLGIRVPKTSRQFKQMQRGDARKCRVRFRTQSGEEGQAGLALLAKGSSSRRHSRVENLFYNIPQFRR